MNWSDVCIVASGFAAVTVVLLLVTRRRGAIAVERWWMAGFLAGMPLVYVVAGLQRGSFLWIEALAFPVFASLAILGLRRSPWFLVGGIFAHGIGWDAWHIHSSGVPSWYAMGCLVADLGIGGYLWTRIPAWRKT